MGEFGILHKHALYGTIPGLIVTHMIYGIPITTLISRNYYKSVPTAWNNYLFAVILTQKPQVQPITVGLGNLAGGYFAAWNVQMMAGALIAAFPTLMIYLFLSRYFMRGLMSGAVKG